MSKFKVFVTRRIPQVGLDRLKAIADLEIWPETLPPGYQVLQAKIPQIDGLLCLLSDRIDKTSIEAGTSLKVISQMAVGYDNIHIATATARNSRRLYPWGVDRCHR
jgi:glyoxylate reductase